ncbi:hypothetical protein [Acinetobacter puyangensis]|uniref:hypothetical protein n=1 Tax=Acinetobacter puyangensis TaxID=1096779 RepID=UPI003A4D5528
MERIKRNVRFKQQMLALSFAVFMTPSTIAMQPLTDQELQAADGQALLNLSYLAPTDTGSNANINGNVGFYKLGMEAELELNANIRSLQLGCGGVNGAGACDIDIDYLSLSGTGSTSEARASSSAVLTNPFIQLAIKNPEEAATRELVGLRLSADAIEGLLTFGLENGDTASGINSLSGYLVTAATGGTVTTNAVTSGITQTNTGTVITGVAKSSLGVITTNFNSTSYDINLSTASGTLSMPQQVITGKRMTSATLSATATVNGINLGGSLAANTDIGIPVSTTNLQGTINNLDVNVTIDQGLGFFHKADLNGTAAGLSLQGQNIKWPGAESVAQTGWWLELSNPIDIGDITPSGTVDISLSTIVETLAKVSNYLAANPVDCGILALSCIAGSINTGTVNLTGVTPASMTLKDVVLTNQSFAPNCWGNVKFC